MEIAVLSLPTLASIRTFIRDTLCQPDRLDPSQAEFFQTILTKKNQPIGILFHLKGPRELKTSAIWSLSDHQIIFYTSTGSRFLEVKLSESPESLFPENSSQAA